MWGFRGTSTRTARQWQVAVSMAASVPKVARSHTALTLAVRERRPIWTRVAGPEGARREAGPARRLLLGVDRLLDMCRTTVNVTGDLATAVSRQAMASGTCPAQPAAPAVLPRPRREARRRPGALGDTPPSRDSVVTPVVT